MLTFVAFMGGQAVREVTAIVTREDGKIVDSMTYRADDHSLLAMIKQFTACMSFENEVRVRLEAFFDMYAIHSFFTNSKSTLSQTMLEDIEMTTSVQELLLESEVGEDSFTLAMKMIDTYKRREAAPFSRLHDDCDRCNHEPE